MVKPPNILVFTPPSQPSQTFQRLKNLLRSLLEPDAYTIYPLKVSTCLQSPWMDHTQLLIHLEPAFSDPEVGSRFQSYMRLPQAMMLHVNPDGRLATDLQLVLFSHLNPISTRLWVSRTLEEMEEDTWKIILGQNFGLKLQTGLNPSGKGLNGPGYLYAQNPVEKLGDLTFHAESKTDLGMKDILRLESPLLHQTTFLRHLRTRYLGQVLLFYPVIGSTFEPLNQTLGHGVVVLAHRQSAGQGRGGNEWLSPPGCLMFSLQLKLDLKSGLVQRVSLIQHLIALALVHAVSNLSKSSEDHILRLKWPNDIYFGSETKMGGVLAKSSFCGSEVVVNIGLGFNLDNALPTLSLNSILKRDLSREVILAEVLNVLEDLLDQLEDGKIEALLQLYHRYWLHQDQLVRVKQEQSDDIEVKIKSINEFGFLIAERLDTKASLTLHPDGNSFDMFQGLIFSKQ